MRKLAEKKVVIVSPRAFGVLVQDTRQGTDKLFVEHLIHANDPLPAEPPTRRYGSPYPGQSEIGIAVWEQAGARASESLDDNKPIGEGRISGLPSLPQDSPIDVTFRMDPSGLLQVHAVELSTGKDLDIELTIEGLTDDQVEQARDAVARYSVAG